MFFGCHLRPLYASWLVMMIAFPLAGCDEEKAHELPFKVSFACPDTREAADQLTLRVVRDGCGGDDVVMEQTLAKGDSARAVNGIAAGVYGLEAQALSDGVALASDCVEVSLPLMKGAEVPTIRLRSEGCVEQPEPEDAGDGGEASLDAGLDANVPALDGSANDAGSAAETSTGPRTCTGDCSDPFPCTEDRCVEGQCVHEPFTGNRECDGIACTVGDRCDQGTCQAGTPDNSACPDDGNPCTAETCEAESGCNRDNAEGATCNDQIACTGQDACRGGICRGTDSCGSGAGICSAATGMCTACTSAADCDDRDPCSTDTCSAGACKHVNNTAACNDGKSCTSNDICSNRVCAGTSTCPSDATCGGSTCKCNDASKALCSNTCVVLASSNTNCGQCGRACNNGSCQNSACKPNAATNCTAYRYGGHDYLLCSDALSWASARDRCRGYGFGLAIIDNQGENDFLRTRPNAVDRWMGANDRGSNGKNCVRDEEEGSWYWSDPNSTSNENFRLFCAFADRNANSCTASNGAYQNWRSGEPNNDSCDSCVIGDCSEGEDCGVLNADGSWNDAECNNQLAFVCETP